MNTENDLNALHRLLSNLYKIKSASYDLLQRRFLSEGSIPVFENYSFYREIIDPKDLRVGARFIQTQHDDHDKLIFLYDGKMRVKVDWHERTMQKQILEFVTNPPVLIQGPFFTRIKGLLRYALQSSNVGMIFGRSLLIKKWQEFFEDDYSGIFAAWRAKSFQFPASSLHTISMIISNCGGCPGLSTSPIRRCRTMASSPEILIT